jgi:hypothetical protein
MNKLLVIIKSHQNLEETMWYFSKQIYKRNCDRRIVAQGQPKQKVIRTPISNNQPGVVTHICNLGCSRGGSRTIAMGGQLQAQIGDPNRKTTKSFSGLGYDSSVGNLPSKHKALIPCTPI